MFEKNMLVKVCLNNCCVRRKVNSEQVEKNKNCIIIIPKKNVRLASKRNKIRRQIRAIVRSLKVDVRKKIVIKYFDQNIQPNFQELKNTILTNISLLKV